jgi:general secretion pathway protein G
MALINKPADTVQAAKWNGPYLENAPPLDPWGRPYRYQSPATKGDFDLMSYGKDGQLGGTGDAADVSN